MAPVDPGRPELDQAVQEQVEIQVKYAGYLARQLRQVEEFAKAEARQLPPDTDYAAIAGLRLEAREKLSAIRPVSIGQASRISACPGGYCRTADLAGATKGAKMKTVTIYTDGACSGNPGPGGWGAILEYQGVERELSGGEEKTTNNRMELTAVLQALQCLKQPCIVELYSDSKYVIDALQKGWAIAGAAGAGGRRIKNRR